MILASECFINEWKSKFSTFHKCVSVDKLVVVGQSALYKLMIPIQFLLHYYLTN